MTWLVTWKPSRRAVPLLLGSYCGCSDSRDVCTSRSLMPAFLDRGQHRGHLPGIGVAGFARGLAAGGDADADHRGVRRDVDGGIAGDGQKLVGGERRPGENRRGGEENENAHLGLHLIGTNTLTTRLPVGLHRVGDVFLDEQVLGFELLLIEIIGDRLVGRIRSSRTSRDART